MRAVGCGADQLINIGADLSQQFLDDGKQLGFPFHLLKQVRREWAAVVRWQIFEGWISNHCD